MKIYVKPLAIFGLMIMTAQSAGAIAATVNSEEQFSLATNDGLAHVHGVLTLPKNMPGSLPIPVILVGGTVSSRDGAAYALQSKADYRDKFWYKTLSQVLVNAGFATVRYDERGIGSGLECDRILGVQAGPDMYIESGGRCYDAQAAATTTFATKRQDIASVMTMVGTDKRLDGRRSIIIAHSEGGVHLAALLGQALIHPAGIVLIGVPVESLDSVHRWQHIDRQWDWMARLVDQNGGSISNAAAEKYYQESPAAYDRPIVATEGSWSRKNLPELRNRLVQIRDNDVAAAFAAPAGGLATGTMDNAIEGVVVGASEYYQLLVTDNVSAIGALTGYSGAITFIYGGRDTSVPSRRQVNLIRQSATLNSHAKVVFLEEVDHNLAGADGHVVPAGINAVVDAVLRVGSRVEHH